MTIDDARARLFRLQAERLDAREVGVPECSPYMVRLNAAIDDARAGYTRVAVIEIAALRRELARPHVD